MNDTFESVLGGDPHRIAAFEGVKVGVDGGMLAQCCLLFAGFFWIMIQVVC